MQKQEKILSCLKEEYMLTKLSLTKSINLAMEVMETSIEFFIRNLERNMH